MPPLPVKPRRFSAMSRRSALLGATLALPATGGDFHRPRNPLRVPSGIAQELAAAVCAVAVGSPTPVRQFPGAPWVDWLDEPTPFVAGPFGIDACYVGESHDTLLIAFRPTESPPQLDLPAVLDWLNDFHARTISAPHMPGKVHAGFWESTNRLMPGVLQEIRRRQALRPQPITIVGYSKGGGMAPLAALWLANQGITCAKVRLFESPRCGDANFAKGYQRKFPQTLRYEFQDDLIVHLPPTRATLNIVAQIPVLGPFLAKVYGPYTQWNYQPVGRLQFMDWDFNIREASPELSYQRKLHLLEVVLGPHYNDAFRDHHPCGPAKALVPQMECPWRNMLLP